MGAYSDLINGKASLSVVGLGYVGLPLAVAFARKLKVIGLDTNLEKIELYKQGIDSTNEVGNQAVKDTTMLFTNEENKLRHARFHIVAVPTPIKSDKTPDLSPVEAASRMVGRNLAKDSYVVFESTVYPGVTEDICIPILEKESGLKCGTDFKVGYSPERINPGDKVNTLEKIIKIVAGVDEESLETISSVYELIIAAGVYRASTIKVAEATKVVENSQRDINIAFINEMAMAFEKMGIDTLDVVSAMNTKWNALGFRPGLVGGHCIAVDPYYFVYEAQKLGFHSQLVSSGRRVNDGMSQFIVDIIIKKLALANKKVREAKVAVFGITFKENCPDPRNSGVIDILNGLGKYGVNPVIIDPVADKDDVLSVYGIKVENIECVKNMDCLIFAVAHEEFSKFTPEDMERFFGNFPNEEKVIIDIKGILDKSKMQACGYSYWRL